MVMWLGHTIFGRWKNFLHKLSRDQLKGQNHVLQNQVWGSFILVEDDGKVLIAHLFLAYPTVQGTTLVFVSTTTMLLPKFFMSKKEMQNLFK